MKLNRKWVLSFIFLLAIFSNTCKNNVGLGGHIDITPPTCQLTFPTESLPTIRNSFTLKGVATDDNIVDKVKVVLKSVDRAWEGALELPCTVEKSGDAWSWSVVVNKPNEDGSFPLKDGKYNVRILSYDKDGKEGESNSVLIIDNTPPILVLQRPSSFATTDKDKDNNSSDNYGAELILKGTAADDSGVSDLQLFAYGDKWESTTIKNISTSINLKVDGFFSSTPEEKGIYRKLYGDDKTLGLKIFPCAIKIYDNAKEYDSPDSKGDKDKGNVSSDYYLYEALYNMEGTTEPNKQLIFPKYKVQDIYDMFKGTFYLNDKGAVDAEKEAEAKEIIKALKTGKFKELENRFKVSCPSDTENALTNENRALMGLFGLNPFRNPTYEVLGFKPCKIDSNEASFNNVYSEYTRTRGSNITIKISPNLDESPLKEAFEFYYCTLSDFVQYLKDNHVPLTPGIENFESKAGVKKIEGLDVKKVGSSYMVTIPVDDTLNVGSSYVVLVKGADKEDNSVMLDPASTKTNGTTPAGVTYAYGVKVVGSGKLSDIKVTKVGNLTDSYSSGDGVHELSERAFVKYGDAVKFKFVADSENEPIQVSYKLNFGTVEKASGVKNPVAVNVPDEFEIEASKFEAGQIHTLFVEVTDANNLTNSKTYSIWCDNKAPEVDIKPFDEFLTVFPKKISGRLYDVGSGVDLSDLKAEYTYNGGTRNPIDVQTENNETGEWKLADITPPIKEGTYKFYFRVKDKVGNEALEKVITIKYDLKAPYFLEVNGVQEEALKAGKRIEFNNFANISAVNLTGKIKESDGIASLRIGVDGEFDENNSSTYQDVAVALVAGQDDTYSFNTSVDLQEEEKERVFVLKVVDGVGRENVLKLKILADKTPPTFKNIRVGVTDFKADNTTNFTELGKVTIGSAVVALKATLFDKGSGVKELKVALNGTPTAQPNEVLPKVFTAVLENNGTYLVDGSLNLALGKTPLKFTLSDKFGNERSWNCEVSVENASLNLDLKAKTDNPTFSISKDVTTIEARGRVKLEAEGKNTTGSSQLPLVVTVNKDNMPVPMAKLQALFPNLLSGLSLNDGKIDGLKSGTSTIPATKYVFEFVPKGDGSDDGRYVFNLSSGTVEKKFVVIVDNKAPSITPIYPALGATFFDATTDIKISCYDEASGIKEHGVKCEYKAGKSIEMTVANGSYTCKIPAVDMQEGSYTLKFKAEDNLGNLIDIELPSLYYDKVAPTIELTGVVPDRMGASETVSIVVNAEDSNGLKSFVPSLIKKADSSESWKEPENITGKTFNKTIVLDATKFTKGDGLYLLRIECKDVAEKTSKIIEKEINYDATAPTLVITTSFPTWTNTKTYKVEGTASDAGVGVRVVKYKVNNGSEQVFSGKDSWNGYVELNEGENTLTIFVEDEVKNKSADVGHTLKLDTIAPTLTFVEPSTSEKLLAASLSVGNVEVSANDPVSAGSTASGIKEVRYSENLNSKFDEAIVMPKVAGNYKINITSMPVAPFYYFWAKDEAGNVSEVLKLKIEVDSELPRISLKQVSPEIKISNVSYTNKTVLITGAVSDDRGIKDVKIVDSNNQPLKEFAEKDWEILGNKNATFSFTFDATKYPNNSTLKIRAIATDMAGNKKESDFFDVNIKQETDIPVVTVSSFEKVNETPLIRSNKLNGTVTDDDGIEAMWIQIANGGYQPVRRQGQEIGSWTWSYELPPGLEDGSLSLKFKVKDKAGTEFEVDEADALKRVKVRLFADEDIYKDSNISFNYDRNPPRFSDNGVRFSLEENFPHPSGAITEYGKMGSPLGNNTVLGNKAKKVISIRVFAGDKLGLKAAKLTLGSGSDSITHTLPSGSTNLVVTQEGGFDVIDFNNVNISGLREGSLPLKIEITDNSGFEQTWQTPCIIDFKEPVVEITSPLDTVYYGQLSLLGKITDEPTNPGSSVSGVDVDSITYSIGNSGFGREHKDGAMLMSSIENTSASWTIKIPNIGEYKKDIGGVQKYGAVPSTHNPNFWTIPVQIKGRDKAGNEVTSALYNIEFDPNGEVPYVDILSPSDGAILGGTFGFNGIARVANPTSGKTVTGVYLQLSETNSFTGVPFMVEGKDYGESNGQEIFSDSNVVYWSKSFSATDLLQGAHSKTIYFRLRGKSGTSFGEWTNPRVFTVSDDVAEFQEVKLVNTGLSISKEYKANDTWLKGDGYSIKGKVTHSSGISNVDARTGAVASGIQSLEPSDPSWFTDNNTKFDIPIRTTRYSAKYGYIEFDIEATDRRTAPHAKTVYQKILLKYDNSVPSSAIGQFIDADSANFSSGRFTPSRELAKKDMAQYRVLVNGESYKIASIAGASGREVELANATTLSGTFDFSVVKETSILYGSDCQIEGVTEDSGSGVQKVVIKLEVGDDAEEVTIDRKNSVDRDKFSVKRGNIVSFKTGIDTTQVPNGKGTLSVTVVDEAGNESVKAVQNVFVKNTPVEITKLTFATDLSGNAAYEGEEIYTDPNAATLNNWGLNKDKDFRGKIDVSNFFTYKNKTHSYLKVSCIGGYKNLKASLYRVVDSDELSNFATLEIEKFTQLGTAIKEVTNNDAPGGVRELELDLKNVFVNADDGRGKFILKITDDSKNATWFAGMKISTGVEIVDKLDPKGAIFPFFYNSNKEKLESAEEQKLSSVVYEANVAKGHIEIGSFENSSETSSVSGKVILRGFCYDNAKISTIKLTLPNDYKSGSERKKRTVTKTNNYNGSAWVGELTIKENHFSNTGHYVEWEYEWDSNTTLCANNVEIKLEVVDAAGKTNGTTFARPSIKQGVRVSDNDRALVLASGDVANKHDVLALTDKNEKVYLVSISGKNEDQMLWTQVNVPSEIVNYALYNGLVNVPTMTLNVVPYISKVTTSVSAYSKATPSLYDRTALGHYPCRDDETIQVEGFNIKDAKFYLGETDLGSSTTLNMASASSSGALEARVEYTDNSQNKVIRSLNNTDDNTKAYNKAPNKINNDLLNNDVKIDVWNFKVGARPSDGFVSYPVLKISPNNGRVGLAFANGVAHFNMAGSDKSNSNWRSSRQFDRNWAQYVFTDFAFDDKGYSYGMATGVDMNKGQGVASYSKFVARRAGTMNDRNNYGDGDGTKNGWGQRLENIGTTNSPYTADPDRIQSPSIATVTSSGDTTYIYLAYYDAINKHIRYRWGTVSHGNNYNGPNYGGQLTDLQGYGRMQEPSRNDYSILAGHETILDHGAGLQGSVGENSAGKYVSIGAIKNGHGSKDVVVALWYNFQARSLMYAYCDDPRKDNVTWQGVQTVDVGGEYVKCTVDGDKGIHVAYYSNGDLKYAYLSSYSSGDWKIATVDSYSLAGTHVSIDLAKDPTTMKWVPYIGYYMPGNANARLAYLVGGVNSDVPNGAEAEKYTGEWEITTVPTKSIIREYRISVGVWADMNTGVLKAIPLADIPANEWGHNGNKWTTWKGVQPYGKEGESIVGGNGTKNPILGYAVEDDGVFELAQKK